MDEEKRALLIRVLSAVRLCDAGDYDEDTIWRRGYRTGISNAIDAIECAFAAEGGQ